MVRGDHPPPSECAAPPPCAAAELLADGLMHDPPELAVVVLVGGEPPGPPSGVDRYRALAEHLRVALDARGVPEHVVVWAAGTRAGDRWSCLGACACTGEVPNAAAAEVAAGAAVTGTVVYADRAELRALVTPTDPAAVRRRERRLAELVGEAGRAGAEEVSPPVVSDPTEGTLLLEGAIGEATSDGVRLDDSRVIALVTALALRPVRDAMLYLMASHGRSDTSAAAAEQLWAALTREAPDPEAAEPAALLAASALLRGDGALANVALDRAEQAWPGHQFARMLRAIVERGIRPDVFRTACSSKRKTGERPDRHDGAPGGAAAHVQRPRAASHRGTCSIRAERRDRGRTTRERVSSRAPAPRARSAERRSRARCPRPPRARRRRTA